MALSQTQRRLIWAVPVVVIVIAVFTIGVITLTKTSSPASFGVVPAQVNKDPDGYTLEHVTIVHRHGLRAPAQLSNWSTIEDYPMGLGFLTAHGKRDSILVGRIFRHFYANFLSDSPREVWARSSTYKRCFETLNLLLGSMYPPRGMWDFGFSVQPIPIESVPDGNDVLIESCGAPAVTDFKNIENETHAALQHDGFATIGDFIDWVTHVSGYPRNSSLFYGPIIDALYAQKFNQLWIPAWAEAKDVSMNWAMSRLSYEYYIKEIPFYGQYMGKMIAERTQKAAAGPLLERLSILCYHDTTIQAIFSALKLDYVLLYPSFLAALHFQLYKRNSDGALFVRTIYHQGFTAKGLYREAVELKLPSCPFPDCSVGRFAEMMNNIYPETDRSHCPPVNRKALL